MAEFRQEAVADPGLVEDAGLEIEAGREVEVGVGRAREAVHTAMLATLEGIDGAIEGYVRRLVAGDQRDRAIRQQLRRGTDLGAGALGVEVRVGRPGPAIVDGFGDPRQISARRICGRPATLDDTCSRPANRPAASSGRAHHRRLASQDTGYLYSIRIDQASPALQPRDGRPFTPRTAATSSRPARSSGARSRANRAGRPGNPRRRSAARDTCARPP
jgi:hypothetical protein